MFRELSVLCLIWGFNFVVMKVANNFFSPELFVTYRFLSGAIVLLVVAFFVKLPKPPRKYWLWIILSGALQIAYGSAALQICFNYLHAGLVAVLNYTMPIWVTILARIFLNEKLSAQKIFGVAISICGVFLLMADDLGGNFFAIMLGLSAALSWAVANIIMKIKFKDFNLISLTTWQMTAGAILLTIYSAIFVDTSANWTLTAIACVVYNGVLASALAFFLWMYILSKMEASKASVSILAVPVVGVIGGMIFLNEPLTFVMAIGMVMVFSGIILVQRS